MECNGIEGSEASFMLDLRSSRLLAVFVIMKLIIFCPIAMLLVDVFRFEYRVIDKKYSD
jgi:hypothetical protein